MSGRVVCLALVLATACVRSGEHARDSVGVRSEPMQRESSGVDTVRGVVEVTGSEPATAVVVRTASGEVAPLLSASARALVSVQGLEVWVSGVRIPTGEISVRRFAVRALGDMPARDGILMESDGAYRLLHSDGSATTVVAPSAELRSHVGSRVWTAGDPSRAPQAFGVIRGSVR